ncbi:SAM-dependent methyltransferase [Alteriqipengyuania sp. WL0013]|uniref:class I SAM-dependent methyltransferase n=1 Tax=Alteriqipengyuania sp. WL0013 TaxID=3110773 RepID=UPI002D11503C|nr:SAM-dependent methyltransferase [Alteriqipengyuania sp. WL0013]MEB3416091.1 SAM-dependent methyltransferase [Alteriqipengyuania sp. WL0013]
MSFDDGLTTAERFHRIIAHSGPISIAHFMGESNARYYDSRDPFGSAGDFITAPEISQMFGELIGLWLADIWIRAGRTEPVHYVELGPGRGTLAKDALKAMARYGLEPAVHLVEGSQELRDIQQANVPRARWHNDLSSVPFDGPLLLVANEFLDALPVRQLVKTAHGWREVMVASDGETFSLVAGEQPMEGAVPEARRQAEEGTVLETSPGAAATVFETAGRLTEQGGAALFIDYGHSEPRTGSTLQAIRAHEKVDPFAMPGEADLTAHVDFHQLAQIAQSRDAKWLGTTTQGRFLSALGIDARAKALGDYAPQHAEALQAAKERLVGPDQMGDLFKVMALTDPAWPDGAGF